MFSPTLLQFVHEVDERIPAPELGPFWQDAFGTALATSNGTTRREAQALGRHLIQENLPKLLQSCPDSLTPLGVLCRDTKGDLPPHKRPICCNSQLGHTIGTAFVSALHRRFPAATTSLVREVFNSLQGHERFNLFRPLGQGIIDHLRAQGVKVDPALHEAHLIVKSKKVAPLTVEAEGAVVVQAEEPIPPTQRSSRPAPVEAKPTSKKDNDNPFTPEELAEIFRGLGEDPKKGVEDVSLRDPLQVSSTVDIEHPSRARRQPTDIVPESFEDYRYILRNEPAFIAMHEHPRLGRLLVMIAVDGVNKLGQTVYRGGAIFDTESNKLVTHKYISSAIGTIRWTDEHDPRTKYVVKAVPWRHRLCGKYWTNVVVEGNKYNDIDDMKRWFVLGQDKETGRPLLRVWSGPEGERRFNGYLNVLRRTRKGPK